MKQGRLFLVRHGQTTANVQAILDTALPGAPLTETGRAQAVEVGKQLLAYGARPRWIFTSEAARAQETGRLLGQSFPLITVEPRAGIKEISAGELEGCNDEASIVRYVECSHRWMAGELDAGLPGGETLADVLARCAPVFLQAYEEVKSGHDVVLVIHGALMRTLLANVSMVRPEVMQRVVFNNCGFAVLTPPPAGFDLWFLQDMVSIRYPQPSS